MSDPSNELRAEVARLSEQLDEAKETLRAITSGEVDALVVNTKLGEKVFTLDGADTVYRIAIENINEGTITLSPEGTILYSNRYFAQMLKTDLNRIIGVSVFDFVAPDSRNLLTALMGQDSGRVEISLRAADGTQVPAYVATKKLQLDNPAICVVVTDLTEQKRSEEIIRSGEALKESEERFRTLSETSPIGVGVSSAEGVLLYTNPSYELILGYDHGELIGMKSVNLYCNPQDRDSWQSKMKDTGVVRNVEARLKRKDGTPVCVLINASPIVYGGKQAVMGTIQDISELKALEERLAAQERLAYLGRMAGTIAHEVRNPLAVVDSSAFYLEKTLKDAEGKTKEHLKRIRSGVTRAAGIIEKLLEMSRMRQPALKPVDISAFMSDIVRAVAVPQNINVISEGQKEARIMADAEQLHMAVTNLLRNAIEAMPGGGTLTVNVKKVDSQVEVSIKDTGPGILPQNLGRLFEPLFTTKQGGVGFGLALTRTVVEKHDGKIEVKSLPGEGATFIIRLPLCVEG